MSDFWRNTVTETEEDRHKLPLTWKRFRKIVFHLGFLQLWTGTRIDPDRLCLAIVVDSEPEDLGSFLPGSDVVVLVPGDACNGKPLGVGD